MKCESDMSLTHALLASDVCTLCVSRSEADSFCPGRWKEHQRWRPQTGSGARAGCVTPGWALCFSPDHLEGKSQKSPDADRRPSSLNRTLNPNLRLVSYLFAALPLLSIFLSKPPLSICMCFPFQVIFWVIGNQKCKYYYLLILMLVQTFILKNLNVYAAHFYTTTVTMTVKLQKKHTIYLFCVL